MGDRESGSFAILYHGKELLASVYFQLDHGGEKQRFSLELILAR